MLPIIYFTSYMGVLTFIRGSKEIPNLDHIKGPISGFRYINHEYKTKKKTKFEKVLVINVTGSIDEFGFVESAKDSYQSLWNSVKPGRIIEIYYDKNGKRIEEDVTLHTFDLKIDNIQILSIDETKQTEQIGSIVFFTISLISVILFIRILIKIIDRETI